MADIQTGETEDSGGEGVCIHNIKHLEQRIRAAAASVTRPQKLALTLPTSGGRSVGIVSSWTQATEFSFSDWTRYGRLMEALSEMANEVRKLFMGNR
jgi:hypothetical protein